MNRDFHYEKLVIAMREQGFTPEQIADADDKLFEVNEEYYKEKTIWEQEIENGIVPEKTLQEIKYEHTQHLQDYFDEVWGEDAFNERHDLYALSE